jgi:hypothetical protein
MEKIKKNDDEKSDPDWMYKPLLRTNTKTNYDGNEVRASWMED